MSKSATKTIDDAAALLEQSGHAKFHQIGDMTVGLVPTESLVRRRDNYRAMDASEMRTLRTSIERLGFKTFLLVAPAGDKYEVLDGHHRWEAATKAGMAEVPVVVLEGTEDERDLAMLSFNVTAKVLEDRYMDFLTEMAERVGAEELAAFSAVDQKLLEDLASAETPDFGDGLEAELEVGDMSQPSEAGSMLTIKLPRSPEVIAWLAYAKEFYEVDEPWEAVMASLRDLYEDPEGNGE